MEPKVKKVLVAGQPREVCTVCFEEMLREFGGAFEYAVTTATAAATLSFDGYGERDVVLHVMHFEKRFIALDIVYPEGCSTDCCLRYEEADNLLARYTSARTRMLFAKLRTNARRMTCA